MMRTMQALITSPGVPGRLVAEKRAMPTARSDAAVVRVLASSINRGETRLVRDRPQGWAPGQDVVGTIAIPASVGGPTLGARVIGLAEGGAWSEFVAVPIERLTSIPDDLDESVAATLPVAGLTALRSIRALGDLLGWSVLVTGALGSTGIFAAQLANAAGADVTGLTRVPGSIPGMRIVTELNADDRSDRVVDTVGGRVLERAASHLWPHAKIVSFAGGSPASLGLESFAGSPATLEILYVFASRGRFDDDLATLARFTRDGRIAPRIARTVAFDDVNDALTTLESGEVDGKIVLRRA